MGSMKENQPAEGTEAASRPSSLRRNSSIGLSLLTETSFVAKVAESPEQAVPRQVLYKADEKDEKNITMPAYRPLVGRGAAAAFEALRHDFYVRQHEERSKTIDLHERSRDRRMSSLGFAGAEEIESRSWRCGRIQNDEQFEMLKLHYLNLMKEMKETALMLNLYEQHQLLLRQREQRDGQDERRPEHSVFHKKRLAEESRNAANKRQKPLTTTDLPSYTHRPQVKEQRTS